MGQGPTFECFQFGLTARSPLLQNYLVTHGLEEKGKGEAWKTVGPVIGRTQISKLPYPSFSVHSLPNIIKGAVIIDTQNKTHDPEITPYIISV